MNRRMTQLKDPYSMGFIIFFLSLSILALRPPPPLGIVLEGIWLLSIFLIGWGMGHKAKEKRERNSFFF